MNYNCSKLPLENTIEFLISNTITYVCSMVVSDLSDPQIHYKDIVYYVYDEFPHLYKGWKLFQLYSQDIKHPPP